MNIIDWKQEKIKGVLSTFDRIIIKGYSLQLSNVNQMGYFLSHNNVLLKDFGEYAEKVTKSLCEHIEISLKSIIDHINSYMEMILIKESWLEKYWKKILFKMV